MIDDIKEVVVSPKNNPVAPGRLAQVLDKELAARERVRARAMPAMCVIVETIRRNPTTGQSARLIRFLAGLYDGPLFPFDLTDLRALDSHLADACLAVLDYDRHNQVEIHDWGQVKAEELNRWFVGAGLYYRVQQRRIGRDLYVERFPGGHPDEGLSV